jgi:Ca-activated chloride channel family protein
MNIQIKYIESQANSAIKRRGGIILKGAARTERQPVHLLFLIDTSGSMEEQHKLVNVKKSMSFILPLLTERDQISLVTFDDTAKTHLTRNAVTSENKQALEYRIQQIRTDGSTNMSAGLLTASTIFEEGLSQASERKQGLILLTDGHANIGIRDEAQLLELVRSQLLAKNPGLSLTTVAYGEDHNADLLSKMSIEGGGSYNIVKNLEDVASVFGEILGGLLSISAQMVEVHFPPEVEVDTVYPKEVLEGGVTYVRIGDLYAEAEQTVLFKSSPDQGPIRVTGVALPGFDRIDIRQQPDLLALDEEPNITLKMAYYRNQVSRLLKESRLNARARTDIAREAQDLKTLLEASSFRENMLIQMMIDDLNNIIHISTTMPSYAALAPTMTSQMAQHETYLGVARGLRSPTSIATASSAPAAPRRLRRARGVGAAASLAPDFDDVQAAAPPQEDPVSPPTAAPVLTAQTSIFSNDVQRHITHTLRTMSQQPE